MSEFDLAAASVSPSPLAAVVLAPHLSPWTDAIVILIIHYVTMKLKPALKWTKPRSMTLHWPICLKHVLRPRPKQTTLVLRYLLTFYVMREIGFLVYTCLCIYIYIHIRLYLYMVFLYVFRYTYTCTYAHTHTHITHLPTHLHTYLQTYLLTYSTFHYITLPLVTIYV